MRPIATAVVRTGVVSKEAITEMQRWGLPVDLVAEERVIDIQQHEQVINIIRDALEASDQVMVRDTDLDILKTWLDPNNQRTGRLYLKEGDEKTSFKVVFCLSTLGEFIIPYKSDSIIDIMTNGESHLKYEDNAGKHTVFFSDVRDLFVGDTKAFMVCEGEA